MVGWFVGWLVGWLIDLLAGWLLYLLRLLDFALIVYLVRLLVGWFVGLLVGRLVGWLLIACFASLAARLCLYRLNSMARAARARAYLICA